MGSPTTSAGLRVPPAWDLPDPYAHIRAEARVLREHQRLSIAAAAAALVSGIALAAVAPRTAPGVGAVLGAWLVAAGALHLIEAATAGGGSRALTGVGGLLHVTAGVVCVRGLPGGVEALAVVVGVAWLAGGIAAVLAAVCGPRGDWALRGAVLTGLVGVAAGLALTFWPAATLPVVRGVALAMLAGTGALHLLLTVRATRPAAC
ncbi:hypothetical protein GCM10010124_07790 [Pilimelia terevasa]|uniref:HdeD family acid-resistance protein n=1 Tax=Pilimelia terevasa TaxID=53372 RepID=A0A8J3BIQ2_9ACTN|nr:hypothetical protein [Pilimelia terevasa]GGK17686.1 hypothetical protein GCM10010124_07790 [Pilimelia terevasa]